MAQWGLFNGGSADWTEDEAVEAGFWSLEEARAAMNERYTEEDELTPHLVEEPEEEDEEEDD